MTTDRSRLAVGSFSTLLLFTLIAGDFWRNLISWWGFLALALALVVVSAVLLLRQRPSFSWRRLPKLLGLFLLYATVSLAWSYYPGATVLGLLAQYSATIAGLFLALCLNWSEFVRALGSALRWVLGLSLVFEFVVAAIIRHPVLPFWTDYGAKKVPEAFYWSRGLLFHGGQLQGIQGNSNLFAMSALLALIVFGIQYADGLVKQRWAITWIVIALVSLAFTRSATVIVAAIFTAIILLFALWMRSARPERRVPVYLTMLLAALAALGLVSVFSRQLLELLGKSDNLTGRTGIWNSVIGLAHERPVFGWGWISYWAPWVEPFKGLAVLKGVTYLQAHDAWLDVWLQLGVVGLVTFILLIASTLWRTWFFAVDKPRVGAADTEPFTAVALLPLLLLAALIAQSAAESRILVEAGWALLVVISVKTKLARP